MYCIKCGRQLQDEANFCPYCGTKVFCPALVTEEAELHGKAVESPVETVPQTVLLAQAPTESSMSLTALICGILAICLFWIVLPGIALGAVALIWGLRSTIKNPDIQKGQAVAGLILGITAIALSVFMLFQLCVSPQTVANLTQAGLNGI